MIERWMKRPLAERMGARRGVNLTGVRQSGKTTLARLTASAFACEFIALSAVFSGVKDIRIGIRAYARQGN